MQMRHVIKSMLFQTSEEIIIYAEAGYSPFILLNVHILNQEGKAWALYGSLGMTASLHFLGKLSPSVSCQGYDMLTFTVI